MLFSLIYLLFLSINLNLSHGNEEMNYKKDETYYRRKHQDRRKDNFNRFQMQRRESFVVTPPFEHKLTLDKRRIGKRILTLDDNTKLDVRHAEINDKDDTNTHDAQAMYGNYDYDPVYEENIDYKAPKNTGDEYPGYDGMEALMDVLSKQNKMVEKVVELYQAELGNKQFEKLIDSINRKQYLQFLRSRQRNIARNSSLDEDDKDNKDPGKENTDGKKEPENKDGGEKEPENKDDEKKEPENKDDEKKEPDNKDDEKKEPENNNDEKENQDTLNAIIRIDESLVKKKLAGDPFVRRILRMAQKKKEQYMRRRQEELAQEG